VLWRRHLSPRDVDVPANLPADVTGGLVAATGRAFRRFARGGSLFPALPSHGVGLGICELTWAAKTIGSLPTHSILLFYNQPNEWCRAARKGAGVAVVFREEATGKFRGYIFSDAMSAILGASSWRFSDVRSCFLCKLAPLQAEKAGARPACPDPCVQAGSFIPKRGLSQEGVVRDVCARDSRGRGSSSIRHDWQRMK